MGDDLMVRHRCSDLPEVLHDEYRHMVAAGDPPVEENTVQPGWRRRLDIRFLPQLSNERIKKRFAGLDTAAWQVPAPHVAVLDQKDPPLVIDHERAGAKCEAPGEAPVGVQQAPDEWLKRTANRL